MQNPPFIFTKSGSERVRVLQGKKNNNKNNRKQGLQIPQNVNFTFGISRYQKQIGISIGGKKYIYIHIYDHWSKGNDRWQMESLKIQRWWIRHTRWENSLLFLSPTILLSNKNSPVSYRVDIKSTTEKKENRGRVEWQKRKWPWRPRLTLLRRLKR